jgi:hypothetical protein
VTTTTSSNAGFSAFDPTFLYLVAIVGVILTASIIGAKIGTRRSFR